MKANSQKQVANDALMGLIVTIMGAIYLIFVLTLPKAAIGNPSEPKYFPMIIAVVLIITGVTFIIKNGANNIPVAMNNFKKSYMEDKATNTTILITCVSSIIYALIFKKAGFVISTFLFLSLLLFLTRKEKMVKNTVIAAVFSMTVYIIFSKLLGVILPPIPFINF